MSNNLHFQQTAAGDNHALWRLALLTCSFQILEAVNQPAHCGPFATDITRVVYEFKVRLRLQGGLTLFNHEVIVCDLIQHPCY